MLEEIIKKHKKVYKSEINDSDKWIFDYYTEEFKHSYIFKDFKSYSHHSNNILKKYEIIYSKINKNSQLPSYFEDFKVKLYSRFTKIEMKNHLTTESTVKELYDFLSDRKLVRGRFQYILHKLASEDNNYKNSSIEDIYIINRSEINMINRVGKKAIEDFYSRMKQIYEYLFFNNSR